MRYRHWLALGSLALASLLGSSSASAQLAPVAPMDRWLGIKEFALRYGVEALTHSDRENYAVPDSLRRTPFKKGYLLDFRFTLDQLAERVALEVK